MIRPERPMTPSITKMAKRETRRKSELNAGDKYSEVKNRSKKLNSSRRRRERRRLLDWNKNRRAKIRKRRNTIAIQSGMAP